MSNILPPSEADSVSFDVHRDRQALADIQPTPRLPARTTPQICTIGFRGSFRLPSSRAFGINGSIRKTRSRERCAFIIMGFSLFLVAGARTGAWRAS